VTDIGRRFFVSHGTYRFVLFYYKIEYTHVIKKYNIRSTYISTIIKLLEYVEVNINQTSGIIEYQNMVYQRQFAATIS